MGHKITQQFFVSEHLSMELSSRDPLLANISIYKTLKKCSLNIQHLMFHKP